MALGETLQNRLFDSWARLQLEIVDMHHVATLLRVSGKAKAADDVDELAEAKREEAAKLKRLWDDAEERGPG